MYRIRYYENVYHPDSFKKRSIRGTWIVLLNWVRYKLETYIQEQCLRFFAKQGALPDQKLKDLLRSFGLDVKAENLERERTSPLHPGELPVIEAVATRSERYNNPNIQRSLEEVTALDPEAKSVRPKAITDLIGAYGMPESGRTRKYYRGIRFKVADPDGDFEPLEKTSGVTQVSGVGSGQGSTRDSVATSARSGVVELQAVAANTGAQRSTGS